MTVLAWERGVDGWIQHEIRKPEGRRTPRPRESVLIHDFWRSTGLIFHARWDPGTICDPQNLMGTTTCGHAMPIEVARKIARPCKKCYLPEGP
jgi:hypothetical protein